MSESVETVKRVVVDGQWDGNLLPGSMEELLREVIVREGGTVTGSLLGHRVRIHGPATIGRAVYATAELQLVLEKGDIRFRSSIGTREVMSTVGGSGRLIVEGDVFGANISLSNAMIRGSVHGDQVRLERCLVLGVVHASGTATLEETTMLSADAGILEFGTGSALLLPYARARDRIDLRDSVQLAVSDDASLRLGRLDLVEHEGEVHLTGGRRLTAFGKLRDHLENVTAFMYRLTVGDALREGHPPIEYDRQALPTSIGRFLPGGTDGF